VPGELTHYWNLRDIYLIKVESRIVLGRVGVGKLGRGQLMCITLLFDRRSKF
jgi:hypothetical protein